MRWISFVLVGLLFIAAPQGGAWSAEALTIKNFFGEYEGTGVTSRRRAGYGSLKRRDLDVSIKPHGKGGFTMTWTTVIAPRYAQKRRERTTTINFLPSERTQVWYAQPITTLISGKAVIWARIGSGSLFVYVATITEAGGIATSVYKRTLTKGGMTLTFNRTTDGLRVRSVTATLRRKK